MKRRLFFSVLYCVFLAGCVQTYGLKDEQIEEAYKKYAKWYVFKTDDSAFDTTGKIIGRSFFDVLTLGLLETKIAKNKSAACYNYYIDTFLGKTKQDVLLAFGVPDGSIPDGIGGEVLSYSQQHFNVSINHNTFMNSSTGNVQSYTEKKIFYINKSGAVYQLKYTMK